MKKILKEILCRIRGTVSTKRLIKNGMKVGVNFYRNDAYIDSGFCWLIEIGDNVSLGPQVIILAHDASTYNATKKTKIGRVIIGNNVFVGANSTILPNVRIGNNVIIGANSVVCRDIDDNTLVVGVPAVKISMTDQYIERAVSRVDPCCDFDANTIGFGGKVDPKQVDRIKLLLDKSSGLCV